MRITRKQLAQAQGVSVETIRKWESQKIIPFFKIGYVVRFDPVAVEKSLERFRRNAESSVRAKDKKEVQ